jgi:metal-responsive CopG/Arc/MetJ family transcriptional regulator
MSDRNQISLTDTEIEQLDEAAKYKGFSKRPPYIRYCIRRDLDEKEKNELESLKLRNSEIKQHNLQLEQEIIRLKDILDKHGVDINGPEQQPESNKPGDNTTS